MCSWAAGCKDSKEDLCPIGQTSVCWNRERSRGFLKRKEEEKVKGFLDSRKGTVLSAGVVTPGNPSVTPTNTINDLPVMWQAVLGTTGDSSKYREAFFVAEFESSNYTALTLLLDVLISQESPRILVARILSLSSELLGDSYNSPETKLSASPILRAHNTLGIN